MFSYRTISEPEKSDLKKPFLATEEEFSFAYTS